MFSMWTSLRATNEQQIGQIDLTQCQTNLNSPEENRIHWLKFPAINQSAINLYDDIIHTQ